MRTPLPLTSPDLGGKTTRSVPQPGAGTRLSVLGGFWSVSADASVKGFNHPWKPMLTAGGIRLAKGLVEVFEPVIGKTPMSAAVLRLDAKIANAAGESWVSLEVEAGALLAADGKPALDEDGNPTLRATLDGKSRCEIIHTAEPLLRTAAIGRCPLVQLVWRGARVARAFAVVHFNLRYQRVDLPDGEGAVRHLFF